MCGLDTGIESRFLFKEILDILCNVVIQAFVVVKINIKVFYFLYLKEAYVFAREVDTSRSRKVFISGLAIDRNLML